MQSGSQTLETHPGSEAAFRLLFMDHPLPMWMVDLDSLAFLEVNEAAVQLYGYSRDEFLGMTIADIRPAEDVPRLLAHLVDSETGLYRAGEWRHRCRDGRLIDVEITSHILDFQGHRAALVTIEDVTARKQAERELVRHGERMENAFINADVLMAYLDRDFHFIRVNRAYAAAGGLAAVDFVGRRHFELYPNAENEALFRQVLATGEALFVREKPFAYPDQPERGVTYWDWHLQPVKTADGRVEELILSLVDVTERVRRRHTEMELRESEERFRLLVDTIQDYAIVMLDPQGRVKSWNAGAERIYGYREAEILGQSCGCFHSVEEIQHGKPDELLARAARESRVEDEGWRVRRDGGRFWAHVVITAVRHPDGSLCGFSKVTRDVTERRLADALLQQTLKELSDFKFALDSSAIVAITDSAGVITYVNDKFCEISQYTRQELLGQTHRLLNSGHHPKAFFKQLWKTIGAGKVWKGEIRNRAKDGSYYWVFTTIVPLLDAVGRPVQYVAIRYDITEQKRAREIELMNVELERRVAERTAELTAVNRELEAFCYSVSHDLRGPLRAINGFSHALLDEYEGKLDQGGQEYLERVRNASQRMAQLIDDLLDLSRITRSEMRREETDLSGIAWQVAESLYASAPAREVEFAIAPQVVAQVDPKLLKIVLDNLLGNAWKFTREQAGARIGFGVREEGGERVYFVRDNGVGFDMAYVDKLFKPFHRLHGALEFDGTGIGLATVQRIVERHGGRIWAEGMVGQGAAFFFTLPFTGAGQARPEAARRRRRGSVA
ncbi:MAG: PAS domain-containing sensor histidine kinase [Pseudomonadota bacterium]